MRNYKHSEKNALRYPIELPWRSLIWTLKEGDILSNNEEEQYIVTRVQRSAVPGESPVIELKPCQQPRSKDMGLQA